LSLAAVYFVLADHDNKVEGFVNLMAAHDPPLSGAMRIRVFTNNRMKRSPRMSRFFSA
jgi:hypothetical protein